MAPLHPCINLTALACIRNITVPDSSKPNTFLLYCDFHLQKTGHLTIPVSKYFENGNAPPVGSYVWLSGPVLMPPRSDGLIEAEAFEVVADSTAVTLVLPSPAVVAVGTVATVLGRDIHMDVGAYSRETRAVVTYQIIVTVPNNARRANMKMPQSGSNIMICGSLSYIAMHEDIDLPGVELEGITFLPRTDFSRKDEPSAGTRTKRQLLSEKGTTTIDVGHPMKKTKSGPLDVFTKEELGAGSSSEASSSQSSIGSSSPPSVGSPSQLSDSPASSQSSFASTHRPAKDIPGPAKSTRAASRAAL